MMFVLCHVKYCEVAVNTQPYDNIIPYTFVENPLHLKQFCLQTLAEHKLHLKLCNRLNREVLISLVITDVRQLKKPVDQDLSFTSACQTEARWGIATVLGGEREWSHALEMRAHTEAQPEPCACPGRWANIQR